MARGQSFGHPWGRPIAEVSAVVAFDLYYTEPKKPPMWSYSRVKAYLSASSLGVGGWGGCFEASLLKGAVLIEPLRY